MSIDFVTLLRRAPGYTNQISHVEPLPARAASYASPAKPLPAVLSALLAERGMSQLYAHQAAALDAARAGNHLGIVTATASGKTLCYQLPALEALLADPRARALCLFPTKALAGDQLRSLRILSEPLGIPVATLDGDTPRPERDTVRARARIILSNPDMLHRTLLPDHRRWATLLAGLRFVVLDEAHTYRGVFGTHVALIMRRLRRLCAHYGAAPQFICCSATSANPDEHLQALIGAPVQVINGDGAPQGPRSFALWNPPMIDGKRKSKEQHPAAESGQRRSTNVETAALLVSLVRAGVKTLTFARTRRGAELILRYARESLERTDTPLAQRVAAYRAGYTPEQRRQLEQDFLRGEILGLVSTNALELGVDIGGVDAVVIGGFPGTVASAWQQAGRAGRSQSAALAVMVAQDDPLDQFYMRHPAQFFSRSVEYARVALDNPYILSGQIRCAAFELPLHDADQEWFGPTFGAIRDWLNRHGELALLPDGRSELTSRWPSAQVNIRSADGDPIELCDAESGRVIEQLGATRAPFEIYPGAIYLHQGDSYLVQELGAKRAVARRSQVGYYTQTREETNIRIERVREQRRIGPAFLHVGVVEVTRKVIGYRRKEHYSESVLSEHDLSMPPQTFRTVAVWWTVPDAIGTQTEQHCDGLVDALHAMEHACIGLLPLFAQCDRADIGGLSIDMHPETGMATVFVYDGVPGGVGIAQVGYEQAEQWWTQTRALLLECACLDGCPACVQSPKCGNGNQHLSKRGAAALASLLLSQPVPTRDLGRRLNGAAGNTLADESGARSVIADLKGRLERAKAEPSGPRRAALLAALRYRLRVERDALGAEDQLALAAIEAETIRL
jgi:DEAD/DEAH box helicase domain-containing protein